MVPLYTAQQNSSPTTAPCGGATAYPLAHTPGSSDLLSLSDFPSQQMHKTTIVIRSCCCALNTHVCIIINQPASRPLICINVPPKIKE